MMRSVLLPVAAVLLSIDLMLMGNSLQTVLLPVRGVAEGFSDISLSILGAMYFAGFVLGCWYGPGLVQRVGHIRVFAAMVSVASAAFLLHALLLQEVWWWVFRLITGFTIAVIFLVVESWLNTIATNQTRGMIMSVYLSLNLVAITLGQLLIVTGDPNSMVLFTVASVLMSLAAVPIALTRSAQPGAVTSVQTRLWDLVQVSPAGAMSCFAIGLVNGVFWSMGPVFALQNGLSVNQTAVFMSITVVAGALAQYPIGRVSDFIDRRLVLMVLFLAVCVSSLVLAIIPTMVDLTHLELQLLSVFFGMAAMTGYGVAAAHTHDHADPAEATNTAAGLNLIFGLGAIAGPLLAGGVLAVMGAGGIFLFTAMVGLLACCYVLYRMQRRAALPFAEKLDYSQTAEGTVAIVPAPTGTLAGDDQPATAPKFV